MTSIAEHLARAVDEARAIEPDEELCFLMRPDLHAALIGAHISIPLAVWYSDVLPVAIGPDDRKTSDIHIYRKSDLEAMHTE